MTFAVSIWADGLSVVFSLPPFVVHEYMMVCLGLKLLPVAVTVTGSPCPNLGRLRRAGRGRLRHVVATEIKHNYRWTDARCSTGVCHGPNSRGVEKLL